MAEAEHRIDLPARSDTDEDPAVAGVLGKVRAGIGMIPNMYANMANVPGLLETYLTGYDAFRRQSGFTPTEQEVVLLTISRVNGCSYCVAAHSAAADAAKVPADVVEALRAGEPLADEELGALAAFTAAMVERRGLVTAADAERFLAAGYSQSDMLQVLLAVAVKTISNYTNHLFHTPVDRAFAHRAWDG